MSIEGRRLSLRALLGHAAALAICFGLAKRWGLGAAPLVVLAGVFAGADLGRRFLPRRARWEFRVLASGLGAGLWTLGPLLAAAVAAESQRQGWTTLGDRLASGLVLAVGFGGCGGLLVGLLGEWIKRR